MCLPLLLTLPAPWGWPFVPPTLMAPVNLSPLSDSELPARLSPPWTCSLLPPGLLGGHSLQLRLSLPRASVSEA